MGTEDEEVKGRRVPRRETVKLRDGRAGRKWKRKSPLAELIIKEITSLCPGDRYEIFVPSGQSPRKFTDRVRYAVRRHVGHLTPFRYRCRQTATPGCLVIVE